MNERRRADESRAEVSVVSENMWTIGLRSAVIKHNTIADDIINRVQCCERSDRQKTAACRQWNIIEDSRVK